MNKNKEFFRIFECLRAVKLDEMFENKLYFISALIIQMDYVKEILKGQRVLERNIGQFFAAVDKKKLIELTPIDIDT